MKICLVSNKFDIKIQRLNKIQVSMIFKNFHNFKVKSYNKIKKRFKKLKKIQKKINNCISK